VSATPSSSSVKLAPAAIRIAALLLLVLFATEVLLSSHQESQVSDEADHLYSGYEYWKHADFGRNPEHPPLVKLVAASALLPLALAEPNDPYASFKSSDFYNGAKFLYTADADALLARGRGMLLLFALALGLAVFAATSEMFSPESGLLALTLFSFEPVIIANAGLILTDIGLGCMMFLSVYAFYRYRKKPGPSRLLLCSAAVGLTLVAKHSGVFIFPILAVIAIADLFVQRPPSLPVKSASQRRNARLLSSNYLRHSALSLAAVFAVLCLAGYVILWAFYGFRYSARPPGLAMTPTLAAYSAAMPSRFEAKTILFFARHHLLPEAYLFGWADILQVPGKRVAILFGTLYKGSWLPGFPLIILIKTTIPLLVLLLLIPFSAIWRQRREFLFIAIPALSYLILAIASGMTAELRYVLPIYPFLIVLAGAAAWEFAQRSRSWAIAIACLLLFAAASSLHSFPDYLAYANELFGGPSQSYRVVAGGNGDGGQSLKWVKTYLDRNRISDCWFDYVSPFVDPAYYGIPCKPLPSESSQRGGTPPPPIPPTITGTVLISATEDAGRAWEPDALNPYAVFTHLQPVATPGNIVLAYRGTFRVDLLAALSHSLNCRMLLDHGMIPQAVAEAQQAASLAPFSAAMQATLGLALMQAGRVPEGQQVNATALRLARSTNPEYQLPLIRLLEQPGMTAPAATQNPNPLGRPAPAQTPRLP
jgi:hypothetical protein